MSFLAILSQVLLLLFGLFLMIIVLLQRGRGGGLAGAFGGMGGQSAFGTKAGDVFTRITIVVAVIWVILAGGSGLLMRASSDSYAKTFADETEVEGEGEEAGTGLDLGGDAADGAGAAAIDELLRSTGGEAGTDAAGTPDETPAPTGEAAETTDDAPPGDDAAADETAADDAAASSDDSQQ
ncbi:MAG: preprotein translocase subunit SecG [Maioricimonas sp. JB049]